MIRKLLHAFILALALVSCGTSSTPVGKRVKSVELEMTRQEVITVMGKNYQVEGEASHPDGNTELISYPDSKGTGTVALYIFRFKNKRLKEWHKENLHIPPNPKNTVQPKVRKIELGMSKKQVTDIMGEKYEVDGEKYRRDKNSEIITYVIEETLSLNAFYIFRFGNDKLIEWHKELRHLSGLPVYPK